VAGGSDVPFSVRPDRESAACGDVCDEVPAGRHEGRTMWPACHLRLTLGTLVTFEVR
jgi:hypothetical protein